MREDEHTRITLLQRAKDPNDETAWKDFAEYYHGFIQMLLHKMQVPTNDHEDLTQDILVKIWKKLKAFEPDKNRARFRTWLSTLIRNLILDYMNSDKARKRREDSFAVECGRFDILHDEEDELEKLISLEWTDYMLTKVIEHLRRFFSGKAIDVFVMSCEERTTNEISAALDIPANTVSVLRHRVKVKFMAEMKVFRELFEF